MANFELMILRHAKSDWYSQARTDFDRPLSKRGRRDASLIGDWIKSHHNQPDLIIASPAARADGTIKLVCDAADIDSSIICWQQDVYHATVTTLIREVSHAGKSYHVDGGRLMLVGHNPALDELLIHLCAKLPETGDEKLMTTACLAWLRLTDWDLQADSAFIIEFIRPKSLR